MAETASDLNCTKAVRGLYGLALASALTVPAHAQTIDTYQMIPFAPGTNMLDLDASFNHSDAFQFSNGQKVPSTTLNGLGAGLRYSHYFSLNDYTGALQISQGASYTTEWEFGGVNHDNASGMRHLGASNTTLSALFWPYANATRQIYLFTAAFVTPPDGSYNPNNNINAAYGGWQGDAQIGLVKGFGPNLSLQGAFDANFAGRENRSEGAQFSVDPTYRIQLWADWAWASGMRTSIGYTGIFGGDLTEIYAGNTYNVFRNADVQRIRAAVAYWWTPGVLTSLELAHDLAATGGYQLGVGVTAKVKFLF